MEYRIFSTNLYGWEISLDGRKIGYVGYISKLCGKNVNEIVLFDITLKPLKEALKITTDLQLENNFSKILTSSGSKLLLFELLENYLSEAKI